MSQQLQVLQCYSCQTFQTQIVKKTNKWECKICGEKQSVKKVFGQGSGKDCRVHVQRLNELRMKNDTDRRERIGPLESSSDLSPYQQQKGTKATNPPKTESKWAKYLSESSDSSESDDSDDKNVQWHPLPQASPVAFELPHVKKQKIEYGSQDSVDFNPFSKKEIDKNNPLNFDLNFDDTLMEITSRKPENEEGSNDDDGLNSISIVPVSQDIEMKETTGSQDSVSSFKALTQLSKDFSDTGSVHSESFSRNNFTASNTNQPVFTFTRQTSGGSNASQTKSPSSSSSQDVFGRNSVISQCLNETDIDRQKNNKENMRPVTELSQKASKTLNSKARKITSIAQLKRALSLFENIDDYTEHEIDDMFRL